MPKTAQHCPSWLGLLTTRGGLRGRASAAPAPRGRARATGSARARAGLGSSRAASDARGPAGMEGGHGG
ncbi:unnamed protein product, partial [Prorocentrum cordatum]